MSEKEIRETLEVLYRDFYVEEVGFDDMTASAVYGALEPEPDVVMMLRWLAERLAEGNGGEGFAYENTAGFVENKFHVRLTDDGSWEWVEEEEKAT